MTYPTPTSSTFVRTFGHQQAHESTLELIWPESHLVEMRLVADIFKTAPEQKLASWPDFRGKLQAELMNGGLDRESHHRIHALLYRLQAFRLFGPGAGTRAMRERLRERVRFGGLMRILPSRPD